MSLRQEHEKAYLAGFLDADGSIYVRAKPNKSYKFGYQIAPYIAFFQSKASKDFPALCLRIGHGSLRLRKDGIHEYTIQRKTEILSFLKDVEPYLVLKQKQAKLLREILVLKENVATQKDFEFLLKKVDSFRELNYSKKRNKLTP